MIFPSGLIATKESRLDSIIERAASKACLASVTSRAAANTPRTLPPESRYTEALYNTSVSVPSRWRIVSG